VVEDHALLWEYRRTPMEAIPMRAIALTLLAASFLVVPAAAQSRSTYVPPFSPEDSREFAAAYLAKVGEDAELTKFVVKVSDPHGEQGFNIDLTIDGRTWSNLTRSQQDRIMAKVVFHLRNTTIEFQPKARGRLHVGLFFYDDLGQWIAMYAVTPEGAHRLQ
jgi:hypothetical protein